MQLCWCAGAASTPRCCSMLCSLSAPHHYVKWRAYGFAGCCWSYARACYWLCRRVILILWV